MGDGTETDEEEVSGEYSGKTGHHRHETEETGTSESQSSDVTAENSYEDENMTVQIREYEVNNTAVYVADIQLSSPEYLKTAFAQNTYGKNVKAATSDIAEENDAVLAINGDFYGARNAGYVIRNGVLYRDTGAGNEDLVIYADGSMEIISEDDVSAEELLENGAWQVFSFGPALITDGTVSVSEGEEVGQAMASNPRTAIGILGEGHYVMVVSDGRSEESEGLTLYELAQFMDSLGVETAYNLDGGGSSTMVFNGELINHPTTSGNSVKERSVSDIVYIGS
jgi:exopolysaccharide biosynthesis protein